MLRSSTDRLFPYEDICLRTYAIGDGPSFLGIEGVDLVPGDEFLAAGAQGVAGVVILDEDDEHISPVDM
jgi:hypothetical protein